MSRPPEIVTSTTVLPTTLTVPDCGDRRPKLNFHQLIALAIVDHVNRSPTGQDILDWMETHFEYFTQHPHGLAHLRARLRGFFITYDPPIVPLSEKYRHVAMPWEQEQYLSLRYAIVVGHYNMIFPKSHKAFPFMRLPAELRLNVYEYVLGMPCEQLTAHPHIYWTRAQRRKIKGHFLSHVKYYGNAGPHTPGSWYGSTDFICPPASRILALLSVSKKIHEEALPIFYRIKDFGTINYFYCGGIPILRNLRGTRRNYLRNLTITYPAAMVDIFILATCQELENLTLQIEYPGWNDRDLNLPPEFHILSRLRGIKKFKVFGHNAHQFVERVRAYLEPLVTQPREEPGEAVDEEGPSMWEFIQLLCVLKLLPRRWAGKGGVLVDDAASNTIASQQRACVYDTTAQPIVAMKNDMERSAHILGHHARHRGNPPRVSSAVIPMTTARRDSPSTLRRLTAVSGRK
ncbi:hypothetical protein BFW01_g1577 [Lasiodiplodia theobromae]|nr:hypothetical protein BFW01_g1577 [Lasiodiplodia theobromae]